MADPLVPGAAIEVRGLVKRFGELTAVSGLDLSVQPGAIYALLGPDGAGKTTALRCLAGVLGFDAGEVRIAGLDVARAPERARESVGYVPQRFSLYADLTVEENIRFYSELYQVPRAEVEGRADELLGFVGLGEFRARPAGNLSGGMKQKLALCCALIHRPRVLILDEPGTGVDPLSRREFWRIIRELRDGGAAILVSTPYQDEAARSDRLGFLIGGRLIAEGTAAEVLRALPGEVVLVRALDPFAAKAAVADVPGVRLAMVRSGGVALAVTEAGRVVPLVREALAGHGLAGAEVARVEPTLEDALIAYQTAADAAGRG